MRQTLLLLTLTVSVFGQAARDVNREYATSESRSQVVNRLEAPARLANIRPAELIAQLGIGKGSTVVDLGTGTGILLEALSDAVGPQGRVIAEDIHEDFMQRARSRVASLGRTNVEFVVGTEVDPGLPPASADVVVVLDAYHHFDYPEKMLAAIMRALRPGGRLAIVEYHKKRGAMEASPDFALTHVRAGVEDVEREIKAAGYRLLWLREHAPGKQYIAMFQKP